MPDKPLNAEGKPVTIPKTAPKQKEKGEDKEPEARTAYRILSNCCLPEHISELRERYGADSAEKLVSRCKDMSLLEDSGTKLRTTKAGRAAMQSAVEGCLQGGKEKAATVK